MAPQSTLSVISILQGGRGDTTEGMLGQGQGENSDLKQGHHGKPQGKGDN